MTNISNIALYLFVFIAPLLFWVNQSFYIEFVAFSGIIYFTTSILLNGRRDRFTKSYINIGQIFYSLIVLYFAYLGTNSNNTINEYILMGDSFYYHYEALLFAEQENLSIINAREISEINYFFYQYVLSYLFKIFTNSVLIGLLFSVLISLLNAILISKTISLIYNDSVKIKSIALILYFISPHVLESTTTMNKDQLIVLFFLIITRSSIKIAQNKGNFFINTIFILVSLAATSLLRLPFVFIYMAIIFFILSMYKNKKVINYSILIITLSMLVVSSIASFNQPDYQGTNVFRGYKKIRDSENIDTSSTGVTSRLVYNYNKIPVLKKILLIPLPTLVQYLNPINIWNFNHSAPWYYIQINYKVVWLLLLGPLTLFSILNFNKLPIEFRYLFSISILGYLFIAFVHSGLVPRYALIFKTLSLVPLSFIVSRIKDVKTFNHNYIKFQFLYLFMAFFAFLTYIVIFKF